MAELLDAGYTFLRTVGPAVTLEVEVREDDGTPLLRVDSTDPRLTVTDDDGTNTVAFDLVLSGDDAEVVAAGLPVTVTSAALFTPGGTQASAVEAFAAFTLGAAEDEVTVTVDLEFPQPA